MAYCPTQAIEASYLLGVAAYAPVMTPVGRRLLDTLSCRLPRRLVAWTSGALVLGVMRPWIVRMLRIPWFNRLLTSITPTHRYRRYHEPSTRLRDLTG